jgi:hypothetical protein
LNAILFAGYPAKRIKLKAAGVSFCGQSIVQDASGINPAQAILRNPEES